MAAMTAILVFMGFSLIVTCQFPIARFRILFNLAHKRERVSPAVFFLNAMRARL
jgi:hypothetical protein